MKKEKSIKKTLKDLYHEKYRAISWENKSGRYKYSKTIFKNNLQGKGVKFIKSSRIVDIYTRLEILLGLKLSGHSDTLTEQLF